jgi:leucyl aminopeptidase
MSTTAKATPGPGGRAVDMAPFVPAVAFEPPALPALSSDATPTNAADFSGDLLVVAVTEDDLEVERDAASKAAVSAKISGSASALTALDAAFGGALSEILSSGGFDGKPGAPSKCVRLFGLPKGPKHVALVGLGKAEKLAAIASAAGGTDGALSGANGAAAGGSPFAGAGAAVASLCKQSRLRSAALVFPTTPSAALSAANAVSVQRAASAALVGAYESTRFKSASPPAPRLESLAFLALPADADASAALKRASAAAAGNLLARYLVEAPPNVCTPTHLAECAGHIAALAPGKFSLEVLEADDCAKMGMGCFLGVSEASLEPPKLIHLTYKSGGSGATPVAIVGKGLTFDSGGYNLKAGPGSMIELMKFDM